MSDDRHNDNGRGGDRNFENRRGYTGRYDNRRGDNRRNNSYRRNEQRYENNDRNDRGKDRYDRFNRGDRYDARDNFQRGYSGGRDRRNDQYDKRVSRYSQKGDYGPVLARELDSTYEEKVNRNYANSIFVGNLTYVCTPEDLRDFFSKIGEVVRADIITSRGHHRGMGTVEFTNPNDVDEAIRQYDSSSFMDRQIFVRQDNPPPESAHERNVMKKSQNRRTQPQASHEVIIENLPRSINWQALKDMFKECGEVTRADVELDNGGYSTGFGKAVFTKKEDMERSIEKYNNYEIEGNILIVKAGKSFSPENNNNPIEANQDEFKNGIISQSSFTDGFIANGERNNFIFCSNLPPSTDRNDLFDLFETIGKLNNAELRLNDNGESTGIAIIEYQNVEDADICIERLNNYNYGDCDLNISFAQKTE